MGHSIGTVIENEKEKENEKENENEKEQARASPFGAFTPPAL
ncbi:MAG: hypothetical protein ABR567_06300 [Myxococcales bacterium]